MSAPDKAAVITTQSVPPSPAPDPGQASRRPVLQSVAPLESQDQLRALLADPQQRQELLARRLQRQLELNPALGRVLGLEAETTDKLLALLVDQQLANELRESPYRPGVSVSTEEVLRQQAAIYDQQMREIANVIGATRLDDYVDYERTRPARSRVEQFKQVVAPGGKQAQ